MNQYKSFSFVPKFRLAIPSGETRDSISDFAFTLDCVAFLFSHWIPQLKDKPLTVTFHLDDPMCHRESNTIFLNCETTSWVQAAYQFSHELCHLAIPMAVCTPLRWLEESICEAASLYILPKMTLLWKSLNIKKRTADGDLYLDVFEQYAASTSSKVIQFDMKDAAELSSLEKDCYCREKNRYIALKLLPIFEECPDFWAAVPALCQVQESHSLRSSLHQWQASSETPLHRPFHQVFDLFLD